MNYFRIKELLKERNITAKELAKELDITENGLSLIINGKRNPRPQLLQKIADCLNVQVWQLFQGSENSVTGYIEFKNEIHKVQSIADLKNITTEIENNPERDSVN